MPNKTASSVPCREARRLLSANDAIFALESGLPQEPPETRPLSYRQAEQVAARVPVGIAVPHPRSEPHRRPTGFSPLGADVTGDGTIAAPDLTLATRSKGHKLGTGLSLSSI